MKCYLFLEKLLKIAAFSKVMQENICEIIKSSAEFVKKRFKHFGTLI